MRSRQGSKQQPVEKWGTRDNGMWRKRQRNYATTHDTKARHTVRTL